MGGIVVNDEVKLAFPNIRHARRALETIQAVRNALFKAQKRHSVIHAFWVQTELPFP
jgi:predicted secreted Zn-dependent protease